MVKVLKLRNGVIRLRHMFHDAARAVIAISERYACKHHQNMCLQSSTSQA
jgi:hypothetical protein